MIMKMNESLFDRLLRGLAAAVLFVLGYFWVGGSLQAILLAGALILMVTALTGFCALYAIFGYETAKTAGGTSKYVIWMMAILIALILSVGSYASIFFTKKLFIEDFNAMNNTYKQTLFNTAQDKRTESLANYDRLTSAFADFQAKYSSYKPQVIRGDKKFDSDLVAIGSQIAAVKDKIRKDDLKAVHYELEPIRLAFQDILKRNDFSMLGMALSDFHDAMEVAVEAAADKDADGVVKVYSEIDARMKAVEEMANDAQIQNIRASAENLQSAAKNNELEKLPALGASLKSSFIKVYLKRG
jgi:hypothetical protein